MRKPFRHVIINIPLLPSSLPSSYSPRLSKPVTLCCVAVEDLGQMAGCHPMVELFNPITVVNWKSRPASHGLDPWFDLCPPSRYS